MPQHPCQHRRPVTRVGWITLAVVALFLTAGRGRSDVMLQGFYRGGDNPPFVFKYKNAFGDPEGGRFQKGPNDFHPNVRQDPNVFDDNCNVGRDLAPINGAGHYVFDQLLAHGDWLTRSLDIQGYRLDCVKGISTDFLLPYLNHGAMRGKFAVAEFYDSDRDKLAKWLREPMQNRCSGFDFPQRDLLKQMCDSNGFFDMRRLDGAGLAALDPFRSVTFVENHDTDRTDPIVSRKELAYAYILTTEGYPCVFYKDYSTDPGCFQLKPVIDNLIWIHEKIAAGKTVQRWKDDDVFGFERTGGDHLLVALNDNKASDKEIRVDTGFGATVTLHDYTGHAADVQTEADGKVTLKVPKSSYVCYSRAGIQGDFSVATQGVTQELEGAPDLDIKPADNTQSVRVGQVWVDKGQAITGRLTRLDTAHWTTDTSVTVELKDAQDHVLASKTFKKDSPRGQSVEATAVSTGWHTFTIRSFHTPASNLKPRYRLAVTYTAPRLLEK